MQTKHQLWWSDYPLCGRLLHLGLRLPKAQEIVMRYNRKHWYPFSDKDGNVVPSKKRR